MSTALPVYRGEIQCRMLGMAIESFTPTGSLNPPDEPGELVCLRPFPCMPIGFWPLPNYGSENDVSAAKKRFHDSYFAEFEGTWCESESYLPFSFNYSAQKTTVIMLSSHVRNQGMVAV